jgi:DNA-binding response OmpR family regulator
LNEAGLFVLMKILVIEDSERLRASIGTALRKSGYVVDLAADGEEGLWLAESGVYDVVILDLMLPKLDGLSLLKRLRNEGIETHVLVLTALGEVADRVKGLESGADDYLSKPFALDELLARVAALIRRAYGKKNPKLCVGNLVLDQTRREARVGEFLLKLAPREYRLLEYLVLADRTLCSRSEIEIHLYEEASEIFSNTVDSAVSVLRRKLVKTNCSVKIVTRRGQGYLLEEQSK